MSGFWPSFCIMVVTWGLVLVFKTLSDTRCLPHWWRVCSALWRILQISIPIFHGNPSCLSALKSSTLTFFCTFQMSTPTTCSHHGHVSSIGRRDCLVCRFSNPALRLDIEKVLSFHLHHVSLLTNSRVANHSIWQPGSMSQREGGTGHCVWRLCTLFERERRHYIWIIRVDCFKRVQW